MRSTIENITLDVPVMNAACSVAKTIEDIKALAATNVGAITIGSITVEPRTGNPEPRWFEGDGYALNSFGMPNDGLEAYKERLPELVDIIHSSGKKASLSIAGFNTSEYVALAAMADTVELDFLELNLGCPNVSIDGKQKPIASFDREYMKEIIARVSAVTDLPLLVKLSPYSNPAELQAVASTLVETGKISAVVTSNTFPNGYQEQDGQPVIASGYAGVSGRALLPIALGQVRQFRQALPDSIAVIGTGGIETKEDVALFLNAGAAATQAATLIIRDGHNAIDRLV